MCQSLFTGTVVQNIVEIIILLVLFSYRYLKVRLSVIRNDIFLSVFDFLGLREPHFEEIRYFLCLLEPWGLLLKRLYRE